MKLRNNFLLEQVGDAGAGGGSGTILTTPPAGGGAAGAAGDKTVVNTSGAGGTTPGNNSNAGGTPGGTNTSWRSALPSELQAEPSLQTFNDVSALAKSFIHAQKAIGADKIIVPGKHATDDDWKQVYNKLGLPAEVKDYALTMKETASLDKDFVEKFKATAHASGILPHQAQKLADWFQEVNSGSEAEVLKVREAKTKADIDALKTEWGAAFDKNIQAATKVLREAADPDMLKYLDETGLGNDTRLVKLLAKVGEKFLTEDKVIGGGQEFKPKYTPKEALSEANKVLGNHDHPYHKREHPNHKAAVSEVNDLFQMAYPQQS